MMSSLIYLHNVFVSEAYRQGPTNSLAKSPLPLESPQNRGTPSDTKLNATWLPSIAECLSFSFIGHLACW